MNIGLFKKPKAHVVLTTAYFIGIVISACTLYLLPNHFSQEAMRQLYFIVGLTFFTGIASIYAATNFRKQTVVYLEKKRENVVTEGSENSSVRSQLMIPAIEKIIETQQEIPQKVINELCGQLQAGQGAIYVAKNQTLELKYGYALTFEKNSQTTYEFGEGLIGRVAAEAQTLYIDGLTEGYIRIFSGLGSASPTYLVIVALKNENEVRGVMEIATFTPLNESTRRDLEQIGVALAEVIHQQIQ